MPTINIAIRRPRPLLRWAKSTNGMGSERGREFAGGPAGTEEHGTADRLETLRGKLGHCFAYARLREGSCRTFTVAQEALRVLEVRAGSGEVGCF